MRTRFHAAAIAALVLAAGILRGAGAEAATLDTHTVRLDGSGKIVPWTPDPADAYDLCIYDAGALIAGLVAPAGGTCGGSPARPKACWRENAAGFTYGDKGLTPNGVQKVSLRAGTDDGRAAAAVTGKGANLRLPDLAGIAGPLEVQLRRHDGGVCLGAIFGAPFGRQDAKTLVGRSD